MTPVLIRVIQSCKHKQPCDPLPESVAETRYRSVQTIEVTPPTRWTRPILEEFIAALCASARISDLAVVEFHEPDVVRVSGNGHTLSMPLAFVPDDILGPWLLSQRDQGNVRSAVYRPQPRDARGDLVAPLVTANGGGVR